MELHGSIAPIETPRSKLQSACGGFDRKEVSQFLDSLANPEAPLHGIYDKLRG
jgi:hypothetical protein